MEKAINYFAEKNKESKESNKRFWHNVGNYIYANNLSKRKFGEMISDYIKDYGIDGKVYTDNDITQYIRRGSVPGDLLALVAIAKKVGKPLEDLIEQEFSMEELKSAVQPDCNDVGDVENDDEVEKWSVDKWKNFNKEERQFIKDLLYTGSQKGDDGKWHIYPDGEVFCAFEDDEVSCIGISITYGKGNEKEYCIEVSLADFAMGIFCEMGMLSYALSAFLKDNIFEKYIKAGLLQIAEEVGLVAGGAHDVEFDFDIILNINSDEILELQSKQIK